MQSNKERPRVIHGWKCLICLRVWERPGECPDHGFLKPIINEIPEVG